MNRFRVVCTLAVLLFADVHGYAQMISEKPEPAGGDPSGVWQADQSSVRVWADPLLLAAISSLSFAGTVNGQLTVDPSGTYQADYILQVSVSLSLGLLGDIEFSFSDTTRNQGTYLQESNRLIFSQATVPVQRDTLSFTAQNDSLHLISTVPLGEYQSLVAAMAPGAEPPAAMLSFNLVERIGEQVEITADFNGNGEVDFGDFVRFASHYGTRAGQNDWDPIYDLNGNNEVDFLDFISFAKQYGRSG